MNKQEIKEISNACGWIEIHSNNPYMISFKQEEKEGRMNIYFIRGTVTFQNSDRPISVYRNIMTQEQLENILIKRK